VRLEVIDPCPPLGFATAERINWRTQHHEVDRAASQELDQLLIATTADDVRKNGGDPGIRERSRDQAAVSQPQPKLTARFADNLPGGWVDIIEALRPAMARDNKMLNVISINMCGDRKPFGKGGADRGLASSLVPGDDEEVSRGLFHAVCHDPHDKTCCPGVNS
jgi:hypothetical protein